MMLTQQSRRQYLELLALASLKTLSKGLEYYCQNLKYELIRPAETGLIMVRGRQGNTGALFNIGEILITRCAVKHDGYVGQAWVAGQNSDKAVLVALGDALMQNQKYQNALQPFFQELKRERVLQTNKETLAVMGTKVDFITMVRGEDKDE